MLDASPADTSSAIILLTAISLRSTPPQGRPFGRSRRRAPVVEFELASTLSAVFIVRRRYANPGRGIASAPALVSELSKSRFDALSFWVRTRCPDTRIFAR